MNTTFTTYAEKKAKQFFNLLQGYTKGIRTTAILILLLMGVSNVWAETVLFLKNTIPFNNGRYAYFYTSSYWDLEKGAGSENIASQCNSMTKLGWDGQSDIYVYQTSSNYKYVAIMDHSQNQYGNFWETQGCAATYDACDGLYDIKKPMMIPTSTDPFKKNQDKTQYYHFSWDVPTVWIKHPFGGGDWSYKQMTYNNDGTFSVDAEYSNGNGCNYGCSSGNDNGWIGSPTKIPSGTWSQSHLARFKMTFEGGSVNISITKLCKVTFDMNDHGSAIDAQNILYNSKATQPSNPTASGYTFGGWYTDKNCTSAFDFNTAITDDKTLYAKWVAAETIIYLKPNSNWKQADARFAMYYWEDGKSDGWVEMIEIGDCNNEYYKAELPAGYTNFKFVRLNPTNFQLSWDNRWNDTGDLSKQNDGDNCFTIGDDEWGNTTDGGTGATGDWSEYSDEYSANLEINSAGGTVTINSNPYTGTSSLPKVTLGSTFTINSITVKENYKFKNCTVTMGGETYSITPSDCPKEFIICGQIKVSVDYTQTYTVTFDNNGNGTAPSAQKVEGGKLATDPIMEDANDKLFCGWYTESACTNKFDFSTPITGNKTLYAKWIDYSNCVFFKNNLGWGEVWVYTFDQDAWYKTQNGDYGPGVCPNINSCEKGQMTQIGNSDIYYFIMSQTPDNHNQEGNPMQCYIAFSDVNMGELNTFYYNQAIYRGDFKEQLLLFIPDKTQEPEVVNETQYYSKGLWMKYNSTESGYQLPGSFNSWSNDDKFTCEDSEKGGYTFSITKNLAYESTYEFKIKNYIWIYNHHDPTDEYRNNQWFGVEGTMTYDNCTNWYFHDQNDEKQSYGNTNIATTNAGNYTFTIYLGDGQVRLSVEYPTAPDDYRLAYMEGDDKTTFHPGHRISNTTQDIQLDTVSFFVNKDASPEVLLQKYDGTNKKWNTLETKRASVAANGVYNFVLQQTNQGVNATILSQTENQSVAKTHVYTGQYYIRTAPADGGWKNFRQSSNQMTYSSYADKHEDFDHYFCKWIESGDLEYTVANDYSYCISDTLEGDDYTNNDGTLKAKANVRFGWDSQTNQLRRAYIAGSSHAADRFLVLIGKDDNLKDASGNAFNVTDLNANETTLADMQNWIYQIDVQANQNTKVKLTANYDGQIQYFQGAESGENEYVSLLSSDAQKTYPIRIIYDFKTNHLVAAWTMKGDQNVTGDDVLGADLMIMRTDHGQTEQLTFNPSTTKLSSVGKAYAVISFTDDLIKNDNKSINERAFYWISFPFDVQISDAFGFGEYGEHWIMQRYRGDLRAQKGLFSDSGTYWEYITDNKTVLKKGVGYVLTLDVDKVKNSFVHNVEKVSLYFQSTGDLSEINGNLPAAMDVPAHQCTIVRNDPNTPYNDRRIYDSHWNIIGVPGFADVAEFETSSDMAPIRYSVDSLSFYYEYLPALDDYRTKLAQENKTNEAEAGSHKRIFQTMYGYMVQFAGKLNWTTKSPVTPAQLAARRNGESDEPEKISFRLEIAQDEVMADQTFVQLQQEGATAEFDMNLDLTKIINSGANIYTLAGEQRIQSAGNALPMGEVVVPVGVKIATEGEYTLRMPDGTEGMVVELIDYETNTRTNLLLDDYTITLSAGSYENRFALHIQPQKDVTTGVGNVGDEAKGIEKYLIDGKLIIRTAEGAVYDAQGKRM